jgi:Zn-dependent peptidase ImmA (M78 family)
MNDIEQRVEEILADQKIRSAPIPVEEIAQKYNIAIATTASEKFSGVLLRKEDGTSYIAVNDKESMVRQRFTIAHELGHYFLHPNTQTFIDFRGNDENVIRNPKERQANQFAAALLMPKKILQKDIEGVTKDDGITEELIGFLAGKYKVSKDAMSYRLINLHLS